MSGKILRIRIEAFMGITNLSIDWDEGYKIMGLIADGGCGKSSVVSFVESCLTGIVSKDAINELTKNAKGFTEFEKDGKKYTVSLTKTKKSETVKITSDDKMSGGKEVIRQIVGPVDISPFELINMEPEEQVAEFKKLFRVDTFSLQKERSEIYNNRTAENRKIKDLNSWFANAGIVINEEFANKLVKYQEEKTLGDLPKELQDANDFNTERSKKETMLSLKRQNVPLIQQQINEKERQLKQLQLELDLLNNNKSDLDNEIVDIETYLLNNPEKPLEPIQEKITEITQYINTRNGLAVAVAKNDELEKSIDAAKKLSKDLEAKDEEIRKKIKDSLPTLQNIHLYEPVRNDDGSLKLDEQTGKPIEEREGLYWGDKPVRILSKTEKITFGMELLQAVNPNGLPVLILDDFESVGSLGRHAVDDLAAKGYQAIIAEVDENQSNLKIVLKNTVKSSESDKIIQ